MLNYSSLIYSLFSVSACRVERWATFSNLHLTSEAEFIFISCSQDIISVCQILYLGLMCSEVVTSNHVQTIKQLQDRIGLHLLLSWFAGWQSPLVSAYLSQMRSSTVNCLSQTAQQGFSPSGFIYCMGDYFQLQINTCWKTSECFWRQDGVCVCDWLRLNHRAHVIMKKLVTQGTSVTCSVRFQWFLDNSRAPCSLVSLIGLSLSYLWLLSRYLSERKKPSCIRN